MHKRADRLVRPLVFQEWYDIMFRVIDKGIPSSIHTLTSPLR